MSEIKLKIKELFLNGKINLMIGYSEGPANSIRPFFVFTPEDSEHFIYDERCKNNLAAYFVKKNIKTLGKIGIVGNIPALKTIMQLASENQISEGQILVLLVKPEGNVIELENFADIQNYINSSASNFVSPIRQKVEELKAFSRNERWQFWTKELENCIKCYACRSACPMCYCEQCAVENNRPQWIPVASHVQGNLEWHILRAMHLAGRCISCGECTRVCPVEIPLGMFNIVLNGFISQNFGQQAGLSPDSEYALSIFKVEDKDNFIR